MAGPTAAWDLLNPQDVLGINIARVPDTAQQSTAPGIARAAGPGLSDQASPWSPDSPLFWFGLFLAATLGLVAGSTQVRVGPFKAATSVGKT